jgi:hypothetical protein
MPGACRLHDLCTGHNGFPPRMNNQASNDVFVNGRGQHRQTDTWAQHCKPGSGCHSSYLLAGSPTSYANNLQKGRIADFVACGSVVLTGSADTRVGPEPGGPGGPGPGQEFYYEYFRAGFSRAGDRVTEHGYRDIV